MNISEILNDSTLDNLKNRLKKEQEEKLRKKSLMSQMNTGLIDESDILYGDDKDTDKDRFTDALIDELDRDPSKELMNRKDDREYDSYGRKIVRDSVLERDKDRDLLSSNDNTTSDIIGDFVSHISDDFEKLLGEDSKDNKEGAPVIHIDRDDSVRTYDSINSLFNQLNDSIDTMENQPLNTDILGLESEEVRDLDSIINLDKSVNDRITKELNLDAEQDTDTKQDTDAIIDTSNASSTQDIQDTPDTQGTQVTSDISEFDDILNPNQDNSVYLNELEDTVEVIDNNVEVYEQDDISNSDKQGSPKMTMLAMGSASKTILDIMNKYMEEEDDSLPRIEVNYKMDLPRTQEDLIRYINDKRSKSGLTRIKKTQSSVEPKEDKPTDIDNVNNDTIDNTDNDIDTASIADNTDNNIDIVDELIESGNTITDETLINEQNELRELKQESEEMDSENIIEWNGDDNGNREQEVEESKSYKDGDIIRTEHEGEADRNKYTVEERQTEGNDKTTIQIDESIENINTHNNDDDVEYQKIDIGLDDVKVRPLIFEGDVNLSEFGITLDSYAIKDIKDIIEKKKDDYTLDDMFNILTMKYPEFYNEGYVMDIKLDKFVIYKNTVPLNRIHNLLTQYMIVDEIMNDTVKEMDGAVRGQEAQDSQEVQDALNRCQDLEIRDANNRLLVYIGTMNGLVM